LFQLRISFTNLTMKNRATRRKMYLLFLTLHHSKVLGVY